MWICKIRLDVLSDVVSCDPLRYLGRPLIARVLREPCVPEFYIFIHNTCTYTKYDKDNSLSKCLWFLILVTIIYPLKREKLQAWHTNTSKAEYNI